ncbi:unnamed protein product, partial [Prorocentrum cordatum]
MDWRRQACMCHGGPRDHGDRVLVRDDEDFDIERTIFHTVQDAAMRRGIRRRFGVTLHWDDRIVEELSQLCGTLPATVPVDDGIRAFMADECDFKLEHADGSFMDHLVFCHDYCALHYKAGSPRVLLLHSALGATTNLLPVHKSKVPRLAELLSPLEMQHVEAFPAMQRLLNNFFLLDALERNVSRLRYLEGITFRRVVDNVAMRLDAEQLWTHLNYQLIHALDFLPARDWAGQASAPSFQGERISLDTVARWAAADPQRAARREHLREYTQ